MNTGDDDDGDYEGNDRDCDCSSRTTPRVSLPQAVNNKPVDISCHLASRSPPQAVVVGYVFCGEWAWEQHKRRKRGRGG